MNPSRSLLLAGLLSLPAPAEVPTTLLWGDTHNHTSNSFDVYLFGTPNATPDTAYRFARGLPVVNPTTGTRWQIDTPLDFLVIADHAEMIGGMPRLFEERDPELATTKTGKAMLRLAPDKTEKQLQAVYDHLQYAVYGQDNDLGVTGAELANDLHAGEKRRKAWEAQTAAAERHNTPGEFTALIGWEWSSNYRGANLHRVVFMAEDASVANRFLPYSYLESGDPEDLWAWLGATAKETGATFVAIPHNPNISLGLMFPTERNNGEPVDADYARTRMQWEPVVEVTQIKGDSETHPALSPDDPFADFETYDFALTPDRTRPEPTAADYVRSGLRRGLELEANFGVNPFRMGMIGSTDSHTGIAAIEEDNFAGKGQHDSRPELRTHDTGLGASRGWDMNPSGFAGVWATENTREAIVAAFKRREVYASTGPRMALRFFGGADFKARDTRGDVAAAGYQRGVPMGSDLQLEDGETPTFLASVLKAPDGANLDRLQIVKGWLDESGQSRERIYDLAVSDGRKIDGNGRCETPVGNTVDLTTARYDNSIGAESLTAVWQDPDFDPDRAAFYYVRALEIPTPRYSLYDAIALGIDVAETGRPATIQERVYSSPIWYAPEQ